MRKVSVFAFLLAMIVGIMPSGKLQAQAGATPCATATDNTDTGTATHASIAFQAWDVSAHGLNCRMSSEINHSFPHTAQGGQAILATMNTFNDGTNPNTGINFLLNTGYRLDIASVTINGANVGVPAAVLLVNSNNYFFSSVTTATSFSGTFQFTYLATNTVYNLTISKDAASDTLKAATLALGAVLTPATDDVSLTKNKVRTFMAARASRILQGQPSYLARLKGGPRGGGGNPLGFSAFGTGSNLNANFSTSLRAIEAFQGRTIRKTNRNQSQDVEATAYLPPSSATNDSLPALNSDQNGFTGFDIWTSGSYAHTKSGDSLSKQGLLHLGADYRFSDELLVGVVTQLDFTDEKNKSTSTSADGWGWMFGPYFAAKLHDNLYIDGLASFGQSHNSIKAISNTTGKFDTNRLLLSGQVTGDFKIHEYLTFSPFTKVSYFWEKQNAFTDTASNAIPSQTLTMGRLEMGPEVSTSFALENGKIASFLAFSGIWDFDAMDEQATGNISTNDLRGQVKSGVSYTTDSGMTVKTEAFYDGIGVSSFESYGGTIGLRVQF